MLMSPAKPMTILLPFGLIAVMLFVRSDCNKGTEPPPNPTPSSKIVVGYFTSWTQGSYPYTMIGFASLTHVAHAFAIPNADGTLNTQDIGSQASGFVSAVHQNNKKAILSVGGWTGSSNFSVIASDATKRQAFASNLKLFCISNNYDGVDIDWEFPNPLEKDNVTSLMKAIRDAFILTNKPLSLSMAIPGCTLNSYGLDLEKLQQQVDWFGVMTYDYSRLVFADHNSPLTETKNSINYYLQYVPAGKLLLGLPFYGKKYDCPLGTSIGAVASHYEDIFYSNLPDFSQGNWQKRWDNNSSVPYLINQVTNQLISYDDQQSIQSKCQWSKEKNLGGAIIWALGQDGSGTSQPLLCTIGKELLGTECTSTPPTVTTAAITGVTSNSTTGGGNVTSQGSSSVTARGVCWGTSQNPTTANSKTIDGPGTGSFTSTITGLAPSTPYYVRAYATNSGGTGYGSQVSFTTASSIIASSDFASGADGWTCAGDGNWSWQGAGGNPDGYLQSIDPATGRNTDAIAPQKFLGSWSSFDGTAVLSYDFKEFEEETVATETPNVTISGPGGTATALTASGPPALGLWVSCSVPIEVSAWTMNSGTWSGLIANVTKLQIDMEKVVGTERTGIDNVTLRRLAYLPPAFAGRKIQDAR